MWYKQEQNGNWLRAIEVRLHCQGELKVLTEENKEEAHEGWSWSEEEPKEFTKWKKENEE